MAETLPIHTINARGNIMLEVMRSHFAMSPEQMFREIQGMRRSVDAALSFKNVNYSDLRSALVPSQERNEVALIFDTLKIDDNWYGNDVFKRIIPLLDKRSNHSVLVGDYLDRKGQEEQLFKAFQSAVLPRRPIEYRYPTQFYIVYINNVTSEMIQTLDKGLYDYPAYAGFADMTYISMFKIYLSTMLINLFVKKGRTIIQAHESDCDDGEDYNMCGYPFEENGFICRSINDDLAGVLLSYKIERPVYSGFEEDTEFALNAIGMDVHCIADFQVELAEAKLKYLKENKSGSMARAGLEKVSAEELAELIREKISHNYIYDLSFVPEHNVRKFSTVLELKPPGGGATRLKATLAYEPNKKNLRLITLY